MPIASYLLPCGTPSYGFVTGDSLRDAGDALRARAADLRTFLATGEDLSAVAEGATLALSEVKLLSPLPNPDKIICIGLNYLSHIHETGREKPSHPPIFTRYAGSVVAHGEDLLRPKLSTWFDFEGELAVIIGKGGRHIPEAEAMAAIAGYSCFNDGSVRDYQRHSSQFWPGKNFDRSGSMGPVMVTSAEMPDPAAQQMVTRLNGEEVQSTPISDLAFDIPALIAYCSSICTLLPGDVIATGTPGGVGLFREPKLFMKAGDTVEVEISGIGILRNGVADEA